MKNFLDIACAGDVSQQTPLFVIGNKRGRLLPVDLQSRSDGLFLVVLALDNLTTAFIAHPLDVRGAEGHMVGLLAILTGPSPGEAANELIVAHLNIHDMVDRASRLPQGLGEGVGLDLCARKAV